MLPPAGKDYSPLNRLLAIFSPATSVTHGQVIVIIKRAEKKFVDVHVCINQGHTIN